jgi:hypothetical protein
LVFEEIYEDSSLVAWDAGLQMEAADFLSETLLMYVSDTRCHTLSRENRGNILHRNVGKCVPDYSASYPLFCEDEGRRLHGIAPQKTSVPVAAVRTGISRK